MSEDNQADAEFIALADAFVALAVKGSVSGIRRSLLEGVDANCTGNSQLLCVTYVLVRCTVHLRIF